MKVGKIIGRVALGALALSVVPYQFKKDEETGSEGARKVIDGLMGMVLEQRAAAKAAKDWATSDHIRDSLKALGIQVKDTKDGAEWTLE